MTGLTRRGSLSKIGAYLMTFSFAALSPLRRALAEKIVDSMPKEGPVKLPMPRIDGDTSIEKAIKYRRTVRSFNAQPLSTEQLSQLLWAAQGITQDRGVYRAAPSAGALYPMDIYAVVGKDGVQGLNPGLYHYEPEGHRVSLALDADIRYDVARASLSQMWMGTAPLIMVITAEFDRITMKYGSRGVRYAMIEAGHIGQNIFLQAEGMGLKAGIVGAFHDKDIIQAMKTPMAREPLLIMPVGHKA